MKVLSIHLAEQSSGIPWVNAIIDVPGLGEIKIKDCVSKETYDSLCKEVIFALRNKMGLKEEEQKV